MGFRIQISDTAVESPEENLSKPFDTFFQAKGKEWANEGTGLGLWICKQSVIRWEGEIQVYIVNEGTTLFLYPSK